MIDEHDPNEDAPRCAVCGRQIMAVDRSSRWFHVGDGPVDHVAEPRR